MSEQRFCDITWESRMNESNQILTMPGFKPDAEDPDTWQMYTIGPLGIVRVDFADVGEWAEQLRHWADVVEDQVIKHTEARAKLGLETK